MTAEFEKWYESEKERFHSGQFDEKQIAYSAWLAGRRQQRKSDKENTDTQRTRILKLNAYRFMRMHWNGPTVTPKERTRVLNKIKHYRRTHNITVEQLYKNGTDIRGIGPITLRRIRDRIDALIQEK